MDTLFDSRKACAGRTFAQDSIRVLCATAIILLVPALAMQFTDEVAWGALDVAVAGALLAGTGLAFAWLSRRMAGRWQRVATGVALAAGLLLVWMELAVGIFGTPLAGT